ncbi:hypothetical protein Q4F19_00050 [Sphingomonas sp. BIUV-7]|uniref:Glycosyltransferase RgtA/B/C/D-like domain-containing protein n=1 Tax=Sphingomonas natans TaxID=3063330 RepID=A0ABT8Y366_9SPHN|nr:hypothetical protein [Sphingomonas sp. BIUV-7]MDO6412764.1 hypothetical protein [Sphingomonas sp. BIUV-7]
MIKRAPALRLPAWALALLIAILALDVVSLLGATRTIIGYRYNVDYGEGIVWQQMINMVAGRGYSPIGVFPAIVYHYPPVYHLAVAALVRVTGADPLFTGRALSFAATLASAVAVGLIARAAIATVGDRRTAIAGGLFAGLLFPVCQPVAEWSATMRVDMLACLFTLCGLLLTIMALRRPRLILAAALCFTLGVYTKQVTVAAPAAAILGLLLTRPRLGWTCLVACLVIGLAALGTLTLMTHGGFLRHIVLYNMNRNEAHRLWSLLPPLRAHVAFVLMALLGCGIAWASFRRESGGSERRAILLILGLYLILRTLMLAMIVKSGGSSNYLIEWFAPLAILAALGASPAFAFAVGERPPAGWPFSPESVAPTLLLIAAAIQAIPLAQWGDFTAAAHAKAGRLDRLVHAIHATPAPVISDDMTLLIRAGRSAEWEPAIAAELAALGRYDEPAFVALVRRRCFGGFITDGDRGDTTYDSRYNPAVADAMDATYPRRFIYAGMVLHLPPHGLAPRDCPGIR